MTYRELVTQLLLNEVKTHGVPDGPNEFEDESIQEQAEHQVRGVFAIADEFLRILDERDDRVIFKGSVVSVESQHVEIGEVKT